MTLTVLRGSSSKAINHELMLHAFEATPSLIVDCANCADPHQLFPTITQEQLSRVYVMNAEAIYRFRDTLLKLPYYIAELELNRILVTTIHTLFSYDDDIENKHILEHCWQIMGHLAEMCDENGNQLDIIVAVKEGTMHDELSRSIALPTGQLRVRLIRQ